MAKRDKAIERLNGLTGGKESKWLVEARERLSKDENKKEWSQMVALRVLRRLRSNKSMNKHPQTQGELAEILGVSQQQVSKWVKGHENLRLATVRTLQNALGIEIVNFGEDYSFNQSLGIIYCIQGAFAQDKVNNVVHSRSSKTKLYKTRMSNRWSSKEELLYECE